MQHHLMVPQSLAAFDEAEVPDHTIMAAAHSSQPAIRKTPHVTRMHSETIPSILDESKEAIAGVRPTGMEENTLKSRMRRGPLLGPCILFNNLALVDQKVL